MISYMRNCLSYSTVLSYVYIIYIYYVDIMYIYEYHIPIIHLFWKLDSPSIVALQGDDSPTSAEATFLKRGVDCQLFLNTLGKL